MYAKLKKRNFEIINYVYDGGLFANYYGVYKQPCNSALASVSEVTSGPNTKQISCVRKQYANCESK